VSVELQVPRLAESVADATLVEWLRGDGEAVRVDEPVAVLETDKAAVEIAATGTGTLRHARRVGDVVRAGDVLGRIEPGTAGATSPAVPRAASPAVPPAAVPAPAHPAAVDAHGPAVRRLLEEHGLDPARLAGTGPGGRLLKEDVLRHLADAPEAPVASAPAPAPPGAAASGERLVPMSRIRARIAERLVRAQHEAAILTTFNEVDMGAIVELRERRREAFEREHGIRLGLTGFFARACVLTLRDVPELNAEIRGGDIVFHDFVNLAVAVQTPRGLVVPVIHGAQALGFVAIEREIARLAHKAREQRLALDDLAGGTFTVSNGGVFGSLLSTPILNPPQSGILGMHKTEKRPVVVDDRIVIRPMMYVALSYDHRLVDGEQSVTFLVRVKERLEDPERLLSDA
jgi:2-oxoglutarate dehydrogenase E2 component (dihydrolipoamide succinyltransferase)